MTVLEFEDLLDQYGGELALWPDARHAEAAILLSMSSAARASLAALREVEVLLSASRHAPSVDEAVASRAMRGRQIKAARVSALEIGWSVAAAALLAAGILTGLSNKMHRDEDPAFALAQVLASTEIFDVE